MNGEVCRGPDELLASSLAVAAGRAWEQTGRQRKNKTKNNPQCFVSLLLSFEALVLNPDGSDLPGPKFFQFLSLIVMNTAALLVGPVSAAVSMALHAGAHFPGVITFDLVRQRKTVEVYQHPSRSQADCLSGTGLIPCS